MFLKYFRKRKQDPSPENKRISCSLYNNGRRTKARFYYSKQASGMLQHLGLGDESKILARHRKQESGVCMRRRRKQEHPFPLHLIL